MTASPLGWFSIFRLGLVQASLGAIVVLNTSVINRVMQVELALPAMLPGMLIAIHYAVQMMRPRMGFGSDLGGRHTPWIIGGMAVLAGGGLLAALATATSAANLPAGVALAVLAFVLIGLGVGAAGTVLLVLMAKQVAPGRRSAAATLIWIMMIVGFILATAVAGAMLDPFSLGRLVEVTAWVSGGAWCLTVLAMWRLERPAVRFDGDRGSDAGVAATTADAHAPAADAHHAPGDAGATGATPALPAAGDAGTGRPAFGEALAQIWGEPQARLFTIFVFTSMLAYGAQDLVLEPFAGMVFGMTPGESTLLSSLQNKGVLLGMILVGVVCSSLVGGRFGSVRSWTVSGCLASALTLALLCAGGFSGGDWPLRANVFALGLANGVYAVAAITSMMQLAGAGRAHREGVRMGLWGAAQAIAMGLGMFLGTVAVDAMRLLVDSSAMAFSTVFAGQAVVFLGAAVLAGRIGHHAAPAHAAPATPPAEASVAAPAPAASPRPVPGRPAVVEALATTSSHPPLA